MMIARKVANLEAYVPGEQPHHRTAVKLNTNENPYPPSLRCSQALERFPMDSLRRYPDPNFEALRKAIARLHGAKAENVFVGNGSDEILALATKAFVEDDEVIGSLDPSYSLYKTLAAIRGVAWHGLKTKQVSEELAPHAGKLPAKVALFLLTNPNAPTGEFREVADVAAFARRFRGVVLVDEAYADFARANCMSLATNAKNRNIIVMRTLSKSYSLAGLRVGYCIGPKPLIAALYKLKDSYNVDALAQYLALAALGDQAWMRANVAKIVKSRARLSADLTSRGWKVFPSEANFVFARPPALRNAKRPAAALFFEALRARDIFVRYFDTPATREYLRITVGTPTQIDRFFSVLDSIVSRNASSFEK